MKHNPFQSGVFDFMVAGTSAIAIVVSLAMPKLPSWWPEQQTDPYMSRVEWTSPSGDVFQHWDHVSVPEMKAGPVRADFWTLEGVHMVVKEGDGQLNIIEWDDVDLRNRSLGATK